MVIILIGVLSALGIGLFARSSAFSPLLATQQLQSATLLAQQAALAGKKNSRVEISGTTFRARFEEADGSVSTLQSFSLDGEDFTTTPSNQDIYFNRLAASIDASGNSLGATAIEITKDGTKFILCISSLGAVYQVDLTGNCNG
ncbi:type II secretion system protein [Marinobacter oulmenensis]|uniref:MSHA pilin protein MshC n=1 Tax=Marinobacter oulmenensis TaxID=643747 RepID=A0A840UAU8_9GAMM|nr:MSHA pilin protein MshC [Marinobacter oulmenensis]